MKKRFQSYLFFCGLTNFVFSQNTGLEIPTTTSESIVRHLGYALEYNETHEQANWIAYELTKRETNNQFERTDKFIRDPQVITGTATNADYLKSGYDKGHLAPAADMGWSEMTMKESFYFSNMSPQAPSFNRGIWKKLEERVRNWAIEYNSIFIVTGPILSADLMTIGKNEVSIPKFYYKVILDTNGTDKSIGFILANEGSSNDLQSFAVSVDKVEQLTGIDFFPLLKDPEEGKLENEICLECWGWK